jgi:hypothetical protein
VSRRTYVVIAAVLGIALVSLTKWLPAPIELTPGQRAAIPPVALALGIALLVSAGLVWHAGRPQRERPALGIIGYALVLIIVPLVSSGLLAAVGEDRSSLTLARVIQNTGGDSTDVVGVGAFPTSLPFYLRSIVPVSTGHGRELTSNYIADHYEQFLALPGSPLEPADSWRERLARCRRPTVFVARADDARIRGLLEPQLPLLALEGHYAAYGPCAASSAP